jgi:16S rRNA (guanine527-N7)-methyltransferase
MTDADGMSSSTALIETLRDAQRFGFFGGRPIEEAVAHAGQYVAAIGPVGPTARLLDLGSGGGLPGLVIAEALPMASIVLLDRRQKRTDFLERAVRRLGWDHVEVWCGDAERVVRRIADGTVRPFDVVTARGFGPPQITLRTAVACVAPDGVIIISEPPEGDRWDPRWLDELGVHLERRGAVARFERRA